MTFVRNSFSQLPCLLSVIYLLIYLPSVQSIFFKNPLYPCPSTAPIQWIRSPNDCQKYFICFYGQPITMPKCPGTQIWSNGALNCVPKHSNWNDCFSSSISPGQRQTTQASSPSITQSVPPTTTISQRKVTTQVSSPSINRSVPPTTTISQRKVTTKLSSPRINQSVPPTTTISQRKVTTKLSSPRINQSVPPTTTISQRKVTTKLSSPNINQSVPPTTTKSQWKVTTTRPYDLSSPKTQKPSIPSKTTRSPLFGHPCFGHKGILPHRTQCHWYYNCNLPANLPEWKFHEKYTMECPYPQLFDPITKRCKEYLSAKCGSRFEPVDRCEYREEQCNNAHCVPCEKRFAKCRGKANGIYPFSNNTWSPIFVTCYGQRNVAQDKCSEPKPIYSPIERNCVSLYKVPKENGGLRPDCSFRRDGFYADEQGRCSIYFECKSYIFVDYFKCAPTLVFDPIIRNCTSSKMSARPCGENQKLPSCRNREDGFYADEYGRCPYYFECSNFQFKTYHQCDFGSFDVNQQQCVLPVDLLTKPCGVLPNPCRNKKTGLYAESPKRSDKAYIECSRGLLIYRGTCKGGKVFNSATGQCDHSKNLSRCANKKDGQYQISKNVCFYYFKCNGGKFKGFRMCDPAKGRPIFNPSTGKCDVAKNVCPPCGYRRVDCHGP